METYKNDDIPFTVQIPETVYETFQEYQKRFTPQVSIDALIVESIIEEAKSAVQESGRSWG